MSSLELITYYADLLIFQYVGLPKAYNTIRATAEILMMAQTSQQTISFSDTPTTGTFKLSYYGEETTALAFNVSASDMQAALRLLTGLSEVVVSLASGVYTVRFEGVMGVADLLEIVDNTTDADISIEEIDVLLPLAVQDAFNIDTAIGVQLDVLGKYQNVTRTGFSTTGTPIVLDDDDFRSLIKFASVVNSSDASLGTIDKVINDVFPEELLVFDFQNMHMSYLISTALGSEDLVQMLITQNLLPKPMGVQISAIIYVPDVTRLFGFRTYTAPGFNVTGFNSYLDYDMNAPWVSYQNSIL